MCFLNFLRKIKFEKWEIEKLYYFSQIYISTAVDFFRKKVQVVFGNNIKACELVPSKAGKPF